MNDDGTRQDSELRDRVFRSPVYGNNAAEIEVAALAAAREFFGDGVPLEIIPDYVAIMETTPRPQNPAGKRYTAEVPVRAQA